MWGRSAVALVALLCATGALVAGAPVAGADPGNGTVSGTVTRPSGAAIPPGSSIVFCPQPIPATNAAFCTFVGGFLAPVAGDGTYSTSVPTGTWYSAAVVGGSQSAATGPFDVLDGVSTVQNFSVSYADVTGTVRDALGTPLANLTLQFCPGTLPSCATPRQATTSPTGTYALRVDAPGTWNGRVQAQGGATDAEVITVADGDVATVDFDLGGGRIEGSLLDAAGNASSASVVGQLCRTTSCRTVFVTGPNFTIAGVPAGAYAVFGANVGGGLWLEQSLAPVVVTEGATTSGVVLRLGAGAIDISVTNGTTGVMGASIQPCLQGVSEAPNGEICTGTSNTDSSGHAVLPALPDGTYSVKVNANGYAMTIATGVVISGGSTPHVDVTLSPAATVTGTVTGNLGTGAAVAACAAPTDPNPAWTGPGTNPCGAAAGTFALVNPTTRVYAMPALAPGTYRFRAYAVIGGVVAGPVSTATLLSGPNVVNVSMNAAPPDEGDGVDEDPLVDGNGDGTPDAQQPNVTTLDAGVGGGDVTIAALSDQYTLEAVSTGPVPSGAPDADFPIGLVGFTVNLPTGVNTADVQIVLPSGTNPNAWFKYQDSTWSQYTDVTIVGDTITVHLTDGEVGDDDGVVNGKIVDPGLAGVGYTFGGFRAPIDTGEVNLAKAGQAVPVKWMITDRDGTPISDPASFVELRSKGGACAGGVLDEVEAYAPGASELRYSGNGEWQFNWKTDSAWAGQCRTLTLELADGLTHTASFQFK